MTVKKTDRLLTLFLAAGISLCGFFFTASCATSNRTDGGSETSAVHSSKKEGTPLRWSGGTLVSVRDGKLRGLPANRNVLAWKGIPYAKPPLGELRWKAPRDVPPWEGVRRCCSYGPQCVQYAVFPKNRIRGKEDCLYLNVWRPWNDETNLPVYFWIHGGGNTTGSSSFTPDYLGEEFTERTGAVYVSLNYRLGPMGWFTHPALRADAGNTPLDGSGNFGTLDILKALEWVQENITAFGGNPGNVTVGGESAGAFNIISLLMSEQSRGMFHKAIIRSGGIVTASVEEGDKKSGEILHALLLRDGYSEEEAAEIAVEWSSEKLMRYLRSKPADEILACYTPRHFGMISMPLIFKDGTVVPAEGGDVFAGGSYPIKVPIIIGTNRDEVKLFMAFNDELRASRKYYAAVTRYASDNWKIDGADALARRMSRHEDQPPIYVYHFHWGTLDSDGDSPLPCGRGFTLGACHGLEMPFFHATVGETTLFELIFFNNMNRTGAEKLEDAVMAYTESFLYHGGPNEGNEGIPRWYPWSNKPLSRKSLILDAGRKTLKIRMSSIEYTEEYIKERLRSSFSEEIYNKARDYLEGYEVGVQSLDHE